jgi:hypothetical protein
MGVEYTKCPQKIDQTSSIARPSKMYQNYDFWSENKPSGNPGADRQTCGETVLLFSPRSDVIRKFFEKCQKLKLKVGSDPNNYG